MQFLPLDSARGTRLSGSPAANQNSVDPVVVKFVALRGERDAGVLIYDSPRERRLCLSLRIRDRRGANPVRTGAEVAISLSPCAGEGAKRRSRQEDTCEIDESSRGEPIEFNLAGSGGGYAPILRD